MAEGDQFLHQLVHPLRVGKRGKRNGRPLERIFGEEEKAAENVGFGSFDAENVADLFVAAWERASKATSS